MGLVYIPTFTIKNQLNVGKYTSPMDPYGLQSVPTQLDLHSSTFSKLPESMVEMFQSNVAWPRWRWKFHAFCFCQQKSSQALVVFY